MGVRFACHGCGKPLNIKRDLAGKRGVCPACQIRFRIPTEDAKVSFPIESPSENHSIRDSGSSINLGVEPSPRQHSAPQHLARQQAVPQDAAPQDDVASSGAAFTTPQSSDSPASPDSPASTDPPASTNPPTSAAPLAASTGDPVSLAMIDGDDAATWYVRPPTGGQYGPADTEMLRQWIDQGRVASSSLLWRDGWPQWRSAVEALPEFADTLAAAEAPPQADVPNTTAKKSESSQGKSPSLRGDAKVGTKRSQVQAKRYGLIGGLAAMTVGLCVVLVYLLWR